MSTKRKLKREAKRLKKELLNKEKNRKKPVKFMDALREVFVKPPPKKSKRNQVKLNGGVNSGRMSCRDFGLI